MTKFLFKNINIIGLGLIGGSLAKACKKYGVGEKIYGFDIDKSQTDFASGHKIIDGTYDFTKLKSEDLIIISVPLSKYEEIFIKIKDLVDGATIIDIGSIKEFPLKISKEILDEKSANFIACHPIAGSDKSGVSNADEDLFLNKRTIITLDQHTNKDKLKNIELFWKMIGSEPKFIDAKEHDKIFALVSHLPQFLSFIAYENFENGKDEILNRHFRLQNSNPRIWQEIFKLNEENLRYYLDFFVKNLDNFKNENHRSVLVESFLKIPDIAKFEKYAGSGFKDFTAISGKNLPKENSIEFINQIKSKIKNYEFS